MPDSDTGSGRGNQTVETRSGDEDFLEGGGEMGELTRAFDWASTLLGPPAGWPASLRLALRILLTSRHPMFLWWGPELIQFYNDAYRQTMGPERHPSALGQRGRECWEEIWDIIGPQIEFVMEGKGATWHEDQLVPVTRFGERQNVWWTYGYSPVDDGSGGVGGVLVVCNDITEQHMATERLRMLFQQAPGFVAILEGPDHVFGMANDAYRRLVGGREVVGRTVREALPEVVDQGFVELLDRVRETREPYLAEASPVFLQTGDRLEKRFLDFIYEPITGRGDEVVGIFVQGHDVTEQHTAQEQRELLSRELEHRVKNTMSMVVALVSQTLRNAGSEERIRQTLVSRITALSEAHLQLSRFNWSSAPVRTIVDTVLATHKSINDRIYVAGPAVDLGSRQSLSLSLALNELATNALKYGSLSQDNGRVDLEWSAAGDSGEEIFRLEWRESGGPTVAEPESRGFGTTLIKDILASDFSGTVEIDYRPAGVVCTLTTSLQNIGAGAV